MQLLSSKAKTLYLPVSWGFLWSAVEDKGVLLKSIASQTADIGPGTRATGEKNEWVSRWIMYGFKYLTILSIMASEEPLLFPGEELLMFQSKNRNIFYVWCLKD